MIDIGQTNDHAIPQSRRLSRIIKVSMHSSTTFHERFAIPNNATFPSRNKFAGARSHRTDASVSNERSYPFVNVSIVRVYLLDYREKHLRKERYYDNGIANPQEFSAIMLKKIIMYHANARYCNKNFNNNFLHITT